MMNSRYLDRKAAAAFLAGAGFPCSPATLATLATRGGGPPFVKFGQRPLYQEEDLLVWAQGKLTSPRRSTSEMDAAAKPARSPKTSI